ncbi:unnamed protein product [Linum tenue]|uniref:Uncharacterized protein n=8 Tax=Linum tenue TaxID=586396 RepID=A0AAV0NNN3_9ROSI|nr:unnamed protein product [Linum tenue]CAI0451835.1 unnamed protein product [Linum tenue]CAI0460190.1 unnamed protein product [Linum tenue]CAI0552932.1 unnamed protein product [Linum tenue]
MKTIRHTHRAGAVWAEGQELPMWTFHMDNGARWGIATTNHGESINNVYKGLRAMPISVIVEMSYWKVNEWRVARLQLAIGRELQGHSIAHDVFAQMQKNDEKSSKHKVVLFDRSEGIFAINGTLHNHVS